MNAELPVQPDAAKLAALVFELASQLHVERARRLALEAALARAGVLQAVEITAAAREAEFARASSEALERSMSHLMRVLTESADPRTPLRTPAGATAPGRA